MKNSFPTSKGLKVVQDLTVVIKENREYLSEIDGAIGDGDHGINMDKGFSLVAKRLAGQDMDFSDALRTLGTTLLEDIGGSMGPLYGMFFKQMSRVAKKVEVVDISVVYEMFNSAMEGVMRLSDVKIGDKTMIDTLYPAVQALSEAVKAEKSFNEGIDAMIDSAYAGWQSTKEMVAKIGRASRLGERSRGVLDAIYANVAIEVAEAVGNGEYQRGIVICGTGIGVSLAANKVPKAYCALVTNAYQAERAALSNNANMIALGSQVTGDKLARLLVRTWMAHEYTPNSRSDSKIERIYDYVSKQAEL